jgi:hypothetical protein
MRTTLDLDPSVLAELKRRGKAEGKPMGRVASELLATALSSKEPGSHRAFTWKSGDLGRPRVDLEDKDAVGRALAED